MEKTKVKPGKVCRSPANRWGRAGEATFITVLGIPGAVFLLCGGAPHGQFVTNNGGCRETIGYCSTGRYIPLGVGVGIDFCPCG